MMVKEGNIWYFFYIFIAATLTVILYFLLEHRKPKTQKVVLFCILLAGFALHFLKILFAPYKGTLKGYSEIWFTTICAVSLGTFPFQFLSKNPSVKDFMFYIGVLGGLGAFICPTEALGQNPFAMQSIRFYLSHLIIFIVPLLMVLLKLHKLNYRNVWKVPFFISAYLLFIVANQALQSEMGMAVFRGDSSFLVPNYKNPTFVWGATHEWAKFLTVFTPKFMTTVPFGEFAGQAKLWPFFYMLPGVFIYGISVAFLISLPWEAKHVFEDLRSLFCGRGHFMKRNSKSLKKDAVIKSQDLK
ncbi:MAG: hypothetical protein RR357_02835 [Clostridia bacterium]